MRGEKRTERVVEPSIMLQLIQTGLRKKGEKRRKRGPLSDPCPGAKNFKVSGPRLTGDVVGRMEEAMTREVVCKRSGGGLPGGIGAGSPGSRRAKGNAETLIVLQKNREPNGLHGGINSLTWGSLMVEDMRIAAARQPGTPQVHATSESQEVNH